MYPKSLKSIHKLGQKATEKPISSAWWSKRILFDARPADHLWFLSTDLPSGEVWDAYRAYNEFLSMQLADAGLDRQSARVRDCANRLFFAQLLNPETGERELKLVRASFCHYRHCFICQWRRSLRAKAILMSALPEVLRKYPNARFAVLTLTVRNCPIADLRQTILSMNRGWQRLIQRKDWPAQGWIRGVEVTVGEDGTAHPHFHALLMLPSSYFSGAGYVSTKKWVQLWKEAMRLDYDPYCDIRVIKPRLGSLSSCDGRETHLDAVFGAVSEVAEHVTKTEIFGGVSGAVGYSAKAEYLFHCEPDWLREYVRQVHALKFLTSGGVLKGIFKDVREGEDKDVLRVGGKASVEDWLAYCWQPKLRRYARKRDAG